MSTLSSAPRATHPTPRTLSSGLVLTLVAALAVALLLALPAAPAHAGSATRAMPADFDTQVLHYTNAERTKRGLRALRATPCVDGFASRQAVRMAARNQMRHQSLRPVLRTCNHRTAGENIAWRSPSMTAQQVVRMWMASPGHRRNILNGRYKYLGVDAAQNARNGRVYAAQVFGG